MSGAVPQYPWSEGDALFASALNAAIANANNIGGPFLPLSGGSIGTISGNPPPVNSLTASGKLWLGAATARTGNLTWVGTNHIDMAYFDTLSQFQSVVPFTGDNTNGIAGAFSVRSSDVNISNSRSMGGIGIGSFVVNDYVPTGPSPDRIRSMWNMYIHSERKPNTGALIGIEMDLANQGDTVVLNSYVLPNPAGITASLWLASAGESNDGAGAGSCNPLSAQIVMLNNGAVGGGADKGIVFVAGSIVGSRQVSPVPSHAVQMSKSMQLEWVYDGSGIVGSFIRSDVAGPNMSVLFDNQLGFTIVDTATETTRFSVNAAGVVNSIGAHVVGTDTAAANFISNGPAGSQRMVSFRTANSPRWQIGAIGGAESGSNAGSDFSLSRYDDAGAFLQTPMTVSRANGEMSLFSLLRATTGVYVGTDTTAAGIYNDGPAASSRYVHFRTANVNRWQIGANSAAESANAGSDFVILRFNDAGGSVTTPLVINRLTGLVTLATGLGVSGNTGFNGTTPIARPTVSGAKGSNAALASLLTALAAYGLVTDTTTA